MTTPTPTIGLALGGGGARGLTHIVILEAFDELGIKPAIISGTSIGALVGAAYASGMSARDIRSYCDTLLAKRSAVLRHIYSRWRGSLWNFWNPSTPSIFNPEKLLELMLPSDLPKTFEALKIPLLTVATDYYSQTQYVSGTGPLLPALAASAALPALFTPVRLDGRILIDGGFVNPLPFDLVQGQADIIVSVDVSGGVSDTRNELPGTIESIVGAQQIALKSIINEKLKINTPDIMLRPKVSHFRVLEFLRKDEILAAAAEDKDLLKRKLEICVSRDVA